MNDNLMNTIEEKLNILEKRIDDLLWTIRQKDIQILDLSDEVNSLNETINELNNTIADLDML